MKGSPVRVRASAQTKALLTRGFRILARQRTRPRGNGGGNERRNRGTLSPVRPDIRPELREFLAWYEDVNAKIDAGAVVAPGERERLVKEAQLVTRLLGLLEAEERGELSDEIGSE
jgi:hypothetical protein